MEIDPVDGATLRLRTKTERHDQVLVYPALAQKWLDTQNRNRNIQRTACSGYRADMIAGRWQYTGDPIRFDWDGHLIDGQNRLEALAGIDDPDFTLKFLVIRGLPPQTQLVMDQGARRTAGQQLQLYGITSSSNMGSGIRMLLRWERGLLLNKGETTKVVTTTQIVEWAEQHPQRVTTANNFVHTMRAIGLRPSSGLSFILRMCEAAGEELETFITEMHSMTNLPEGSPTLTLAKRLARVQLETDRDLNEVDQLGFLIYTWNNWIRGISTTRLQRPKNGWSQDNFPVPIGISEPQEGGI